MRYELFSFQSFCPTKSVVMADRLPPILDQVDNAVEFIVDTVASTLYARYRYNEFKLRDILDLLWTLYYSCFSQHPTDQNNESENETGCHFLNW